ncbi:BCCT family transporter [Fulvimarina sp. 2208YS6-2-32]|uniref:BCCT family transporter n=1 Tax=Fulvimarina uroteuthidis TaxID=3098149 RepID=A0ABU5I7W5_9HYPH|nr:BCCT family transporter [Fulvimarina sp. 2208YS6-2-32]MDY8110979.1 BCCT family transporter [Fulvimarina sp. 2208YS6-2-32]
MADKEPRLSVKTQRLGPFPHVSVPVFVASAVLIVGFIIFGAFFTDLAESVFPWLQKEIVNRFGWMFVLVTNAALILMFYLAFSRFGDIRLGAQTDRAEYDFFSWMAMLFSAGIGVGLLYWGTAEPLTHFYNPPLEAAESVAAAKEAMVLSFLHWGLHGWAIYGVVGLSLAYFHYRHGLPLSIRSAFYPLIGRRIYGPIGHVVDTLAVFGTMFGIVTTLGLGVIQLNDGMATLFGIPNTAFVQIVIIAGVTALAALSVMMGLDDGIRRLSAFNIWLTFGLLLFVVVFGPTLFILDSFLQNVGNYAQDLIYFSTWTEAYTELDWQVNWTMFYWAWWISWSPFVGIFIARISRGRTIREFILGVLFVPTSILFFWFTAFGGVAVEMELQGNPGLIEAAKDSYGNAIFVLMESYPMTSIVHGLILIMIVVWFVTSSDSGSFVIDMLTAGGHDDPPKSQRLFWASSEGAVAAILLAAGGLTALQAAAVIAGFPFAFVVVLMMWGLVRALGRDKLAIYRNEAWYRTEAESEAATPSPFVDEKLLKGPPRLLSKGEQPAE